MNKIYLFLAILVSAGCSTPSKKKPAPIAPSSEFNILFIAIDDINNYPLSNSGLKPITPCLDNLGKEAFNFTNAHCPAPVCGPSRSALLYGISPFKSGSYAQKKKYNPKRIEAFDSLISIPAVFSNNGYITMGTGKIFHFQGANKDFDEYCEVKSDYKVDNVNPLSAFAGGGDQYKSLMSGPASVETEGRNREKKFADWAIEKLSKSYESPFFLALGFKKHHLPWVAPQSFFDLYDLDSIQIPDLPPNDLDDVTSAGRQFALNRFGFEKLAISEHSRISQDTSLWKRLILGYLATISHTDYQLSRVLDALNKSEYEKNTIVIIWGDHGWHLGEKEHWHKMTLWRQGTQTPLMIKMPGKKGRIIESPVSLQDIYPTLVELCNLKLDNQIDGRSLLPLMKDSSFVSNDPIIVTHGPGNFAIVQKDWRLIHYANGDEELYNDRLDPMEFENLINQKQEIADSLRIHLPQNWVKDSNDLFEFD